MQILLIEWMNDMRRETTFAIIKDKPKLVKSEIYCHF
jgi:hypothetical protein